MRNLHFLAVALICYATLLSTAQADVCSARPTLKYGAGNPSMGQGYLADAVRELQRLLNDKGGYGLKVDGNFGYLTQDAVSQWQRRHGLKPNGIVKGKTWDTLCISQTCPFDTPTLQMNSYPSHDEREAVRGLQALLNRQGGYDLVIDGYFGYLTRNAVIAWQRAKGLWADGIVRRKTWGSLCTSTTCGSKGPTLRLYSKLTDDVKELQALLNLNGDFRLQIDGYFGSVTQRAVKYWQVCNDLQDYEYGIVKRRTWGSLCGHGTPCKGKMQKEEAS